MNCQKCQSDRILKISAKCADLCFAAYKGIEQCDYAPDDVGLDGGDYVAFNFCLECGTIQGKWPKTDPGFYTKEKEDNA
jgi:hypothetical protein